MLAAQLLCTARLNRVKSRPRSSKCVAAGVPKFPRPVRVTARPAKRAPPLFAVKLKRKTAKRPSTRIVIATRKRASAMIVVLPVSHPRLVAAKLKRAA